MHSPGQAARPAPRPRAPRSCAPPAASPARAPRLSLLPRSPRLPLLPRAPRARPPASHLRPLAQRPRAPNVLRPVPCPAPTVPCRSAQWPYRGRAPRAHLAVSWPRSRYRLPSCLALSHNTVYVLRYNAHSLQATSLAIQTCLLQYNFALHPAIRSSSNFQISAPIFFFFFIFLDTQINS